MRIAPSTQRLSPNGHLILDLRPDIDVALRYGSWADGLPVYRRMDLHWVREPLDPGIPLISSADEAEPDLPLSRFVAAIPPQVRERTVAYTHLQTTLLQWVARSPAAADLLQRSPTLLWLSVSVASEKRWTQAAVGNLLRQRRAEILRRLTGAGSKAAVRFLDRIVLQEGDYSEYRLIVAILARPDLWRGLGQRLRIPVHVLAVLLRFPELSGAALLWQIADAQYPRVTDAAARAARVMSAWRDAFRMSYFLAIRDAPLALRRCRDADAVGRIHDRWARRLNRRTGFVVAGRKRFPPPPIPGNDAICPIESDEDLREEGRLMRHCVGAYTELVFAGQSYIYRVLQPERATLELRLGGPRPTIGQFKLACNGVPGQGSWCAVRAWLAERTKGTTRPTVA